MSVLSEEFESAVEGWQELHGFEAATVYVRHPIQPLNDEEIRGRADDAYEAIIGALTR